MSVDRGKKNNKFIMEFGVRRNFVVKKVPISLLLKNTPFSGLDLQQAHIITDQGKIPSVEVEKLLSFLGWEQVESQTKVGMIYR